MHDGMLLSDDDAHGVRFVLDPASGCPIAPVPAWLLDENGRHEDADLVLMTPDEASDAIQLLCNARSIGADEFGSVYHEAHHAKDAEGTLCLLGVSDVKWDGGICSGVELCIPNPFASSVGAICQAANADRAALAAACRRVLGVAPEAPVCVGVDPDGLSVRARFGVLRLPFDPEAVTSDQAIDRVSELLKQSARGTGRDA